MRVVLAITLAAAALAGAPACKKKEKKPPTPVEQRVPAPPATAPAEAEPAARAPEPPRPKMLRLSVKSSPSGAEFTVDGKAFGKTPVTFELPDDGKERAFGFAKEGYQPITYRSTAVRDGLLAHVQLKAIPSDAGPPP